MWGSRRFTLVLVENLRLQLLLRGVPYVSAPANQLLRSQKKTVCCAVCRILASPLNTAGMQSIHRAVRSSGRVIASQRHVLSAGKILTKTCVKHAAFASGAIVLYSPSHTPAYRALYYSSATYGVSTVVVVRAPLIARLY